MLFPFSLRREGLATALPVVAPFNAFPLCLPQGPLQNILLVKVDKSTSLFFTQCLMQINLQRPSVRFKTASEVIRLS